MILIDIEPIIKQLNFGELSRKQLIREIKDAPVLDPMPAQLPLDTVHKYDNGMVAMNEETLEKLKSGEYKDYFIETKSHWTVEAGSIWTCSVCGKWIDVLQGSAEMNYCPHCGNRMEAVHED